MCNILLRNMIFNAAFVRHEQLAQCLDAAVRNGAQVALLDLVDLVRVHQLQRAREQLDLVRIVDVDVEEHALNELGPVQFVRLVHVQHREELFD